MSPRKFGDDWNWYEAPPKRPPPKRGIKMKKAGATWWGKRWIEALERMSSGYSSRLSRGKTYARAGRAHDLTVDAGRVTAKVTGSREPYDVRIELAPFGDEVWGKSVAAMAAKAQYAAELLDGRMPEQIDDVFTQAGRSLFPVKATDLRTQCSCPDFANPCKHIAAVHFVLGEAFDRDPFLLFELRGRTKVQVLEALRAARGGESDERAAAAPRKGRRASVPDATRMQPDADVETMAVSLGRLAAEDYDSSRSPLPSLRFHFDAPAASGALLRQLGTPNGWNDARTPAERLGPIVHAAAEMARRLALEQTSEGTDELQESAVAVEEPEKARPGAVKRVKRRPRAR
jgi:uncharacterized Zn finger protein